MMYYRRKVLLALLEAFGGHLNNTDCEKYLFVFCSTTGKNHYDFFPYKFGPFSFVSYYDKRRLTELGLLKAAVNFQLNTSHSYIQELEPEDRLALSQIVASELKGKKLIKYTYKQYPEYAARSEVVENLFGPEEIEQIQSSWNIDTTPYVFTVGYEGLTIDSFLNKLIANNILAIVDLRNNPQSMKYGFSKKSFSKYIEKAGIAYFHIPELGIPSLLRKGLGTNISYDGLFNIYEIELLPKQGEKIKQLMNLIDLYPRIALVCFEADSHYCHRSRLVNQLQKKGSLSRQVINI